MINRKLASVGGGKKMVLMLGWTNFSVLVTDCKSAIEDLAKHVEIFYAVPSTRTKSVALDVTQAYSSFLRWKVEDVDFDDIIEVKKSELSQEVDGLSFFIMVEHEGPELSSDSAVCERFFCL